MTRVHAYPRGVETETTGIDTTGLAVLQHFSYRCQVPRVDRCSACPSKLRALHPYGISDVGVEYLAQAMHKEHFLAGREEY